jgi:hypothetical protein
MVKKKHSGSNTNLSNRQQTSPTGPIVRCSDSVSEHASSVSRLPPVCPCPPNPILAWSPTQTLARRQAQRKAPEAMAVAAPGQLNLGEPPSWGSRSVDCFEKLEQIGEGTYGYASLDSSNSPDSSPIPRGRRLPPSLTRFCFDCCQASVHGEGDRDEGNRGAQEDPHGQRARGRKYSPPTLPWLAL